MTLKRDTTRIISEHHVHGMERIKLAPTGDPCPVMSAILLVVSIFLSPSTPAGQYPCGSTQRAEFGIAGPSALGCVSQQDVTQACILAQIAPTEEEAALLRKYEGPFEELARPEQHLSVLATVPRLRGKLQCALFRRQADGMCNDAEAGLRTVQAACRQVCARVADPASTSVYKFAARASWSLLGVHMYNIAINLYAMVHA